MNYLRKKRFVIVLSIAFLLSTQATYAKGFGSETSSNTTSCGECMCTYVTTTFYLFWIPVSSSTELTGIDCSGIM
jgi:hypothetical protein